MQFPLHVLKGEPLITNEQVLAVLKTVMDPELNRDIVSLNMVRDIKIDDALIKVSIMLTTPACPLRDKIRSDIERALLTQLDIKRVEVEFLNSAEAQGKYPGRIPLPVKYLIAVGSGKGGVGKSTVAVNLAISLAQRGYSVGLMDADVYGPNIPTMMGVKRLPPSQEGRITPAEAFGVKLVSIGMFIEPGQPLVWRGPMLHSAVRQLLADVDWGLLDYLIIDLPPGTGDVQISLIQIAAVTGAIVVTLPQKVSTEDAHRSIEMFKSMDVPVLGIIENMSSLSLEDGTIFDLFGAGGGKQLADNLGIPFLGDIPFDKDLRIGGDDGLPVTVTAPGGVSAKAFQKIASQVHTILTCDD